MTDQTESDGLDHTRTGVHEGRLLHASPILPAAVESASEYAELLAQADEFGGGLVAGLAAAIRALEAKVEAWKRDALRYAQNADFWSADRDRLAEALAVEQRLAKSWQETAEKFRGERDRIAAELVENEGVIAVWRRRTTQAEDALAAARENEARWLTFRQQSESGRRSLKHYTSGPLRGRWSFAPPFTNYEVDVYRTLDEAIDAARRAGGDG